MMLILLFSMVTGFAITLTITPYLARFLEQINVVGIDQHKPDKPRLASSGGLAVAIGTLSGLLSYIALQTLYNKLILQTSLEWLIPLLAVTTTVQLVMLVGFLDDLNVKTRLEHADDNLRVGLPQWLKPLLTSPAAIPLMAISINREPLYVILLVPLAVVFTSNAVNMLGGFNGAEAGMGVIYTFGLGAYALLHNHTLAAVTFLVTTLSLLAFLKYNWFPAKMLPGDSLTYLLGSVVVAGAIIGRMESQAFMVMIPFAIEFFLKLDSKFKASCLGKLNEDGTLSAPYGKKVYSWTHWIMNLKPLTEKQVTVCLLLIQAFFTSLIFVI